MAHLVFGIGAVVRGVSTYSKLSGQVDALKENIRLLDEENSKSLLQGLSGVRYFEASLLVSDSAFEVQLNELVKQGREGVSGLQERYLDLINGKFEVMKHELQALTANKAEVVALGLALRELAISLRDEAEKIEGRISQAVAARQRAIDASLQVALENAKARQSSFEEELTVKIQEWAAGINDDISTLNSNIKKLASSMSAEACVLKAQINLAEANARLDLQNLEQQLSGDLLVLDRRQKQLQEALSQKARQLVALAIGSALCLTMIVVFLVVRN